MLNNSQKGILKSNVEKDIKKNEKKINKLQNFIDKKNDIIESYKKRD